jgi:hypothetical protein
MFHSRIQRAGWLLAACIAFGLLDVHAQSVGTAFTYQGELRAAGTPATAAYDFQFRLFNSAGGNTQVGTTVTASAVSVINGLFTVPLDFGAAQFAGDAQWLEINVRPSSGGTFETLIPRTAVTPTPYALGAVAALANSVTTTSIVDGAVQSGDLAAGSVGTAQVNAAQVQRRVTGSCAASQGVQSIAQDGTVVCGTFGSGTITGVSAGAGLAGGGTSGGVTLGIASGGVGAAQINPVQVQARVTGACAAGQYVTQVNQDGTVACGTDATGTAGWSLTGNAGTNPATNFIGTTDAQPLSLGVAGSRALRITPVAPAAPGGALTINLLAGSRVNDINAGVQGAVVAGGGTADLEGQALPNRALSDFSVVAGGIGGTAGTAADPMGTQGATVSGGRGNVASGLFSTVSGGSGNTASARGAVVDGGQLNQATGITSAVSGGIFNSASGLDSSVGGGTSNSATSQASTVAGGSSNSASNAYAFVGGGQQNTASGFHAVVAGGSVNTASGSAASVLGGGSNAASAQDAVVTGGRQNTASGPGSLVGSGFLNAASNVYAFVGAGLRNQASGINSAVAAGEENTASGRGSMAGPGYQNCAGGEGTWAGGSFARVRVGSDSGPAGFGCALVPSSGDANGDEGTFAWADSTAGSFVSTGPNQFLVRAAGGVFFGTTSTPTIPADRFINTSTGAHLTTGGTWTNASSRALKTAFEAIDPGEVLARLLALPLTRWQYRDSPAEGVHLGPVAEEFHAAFGLGADGSAISTVDANGVALAAIQGLNAKLEAERDALHERVAKLDAENAALRARLEAIEARLGGAR